MPVFLALADEEDFSHAGTINFVDNRTDPGTGNLDVNAARRPIVAQQDGQTYHALVADRSDLGRFAVRHSAHQGADAGLDKVDESDGLVSTIERLPVLQRNTFKMLA